jgi:uncharacterized RDD family membrane protein YckC
MPPAEHWNELALARDRKAKAVRRREGPKATSYSSVRRRFYGYLLELVLTALTFGVGWMVWSLIVWRRGQTPAKQLMGMYVVHDGRPASWKRMAAREILAKGGAGLVCSAVVYTGKGLGTGGDLLVLALAFIPYYFWMVFDAENRALWDQPAGTHVVEEREI